MPLMPLTPLVLSLACVPGLIATAALAVALSRRRYATSVIYALCLVLSSAGLASALMALLSLGAAQTLVLPLGLPWLGANFRLDNLSAFFLVIVGLGGATASLYAIGYGRHETTPSRVLPFYPAFLAGLNLVPLADDAFTFLVAWEFMSLASWALVMVQHRDPENRRAGYIYVVIASFGTLALLLAFGLLAGAAGDYGFDAMRAAPSEGGIAMLVLVLILLGAGSKAGLVPLHIWLPLAHPAAPSHVSALMSGVMTKIAIYGFVRVLFDLIGEPGWWASAIVLVIGGITAVFGILNATLERDLKRLLAWSTIENVGVIFVGIGLALAFNANAMEWAAALALTAAFLHAFNHTLFKSLLFFGAGAVLTATGTRSLEALGGLIHRMKVTAVVFLAGCVAISALPPFNGFVSEWLLFQAILQSPELPQWGLKIMVPAIGGLLALAAALAAACFVRVYGIAFLGRPRTGEAAAAHEVDRFSLVAMSLLAALCLLAGILPGFAIDALAPVAQQLVGGRMPVQSMVPWLSIVPIAESRSSYNGLLVFLFIALSASLAAYTIYRFASPRMRRGPAWGCGFDDPVSAAQYSASSFAQPIRRVFGTLLLRAREHVDMPAPGELRPARFRVETDDLVWQIFYAPLLGAIRFGADRLNRLQFLTIRRYLSLVFLSLVTLLLVLAIWS